ncbi:MAG: peptidase MA family metallohydrolase [Anaerolineae bacterium]|nr:peptidase MA family metallohydrolase [Anaerolineae bacterium]MDW8067325.1 peptidase MA family metallohydrolase [Anaerolineae bacterium]
MAIGVPTGLVGAQEIPIRVEEAAVTYTFGQQAVFSVRITAQANITALYLYLQSEGDERVEVNPIPIEPGPSVQTTFTRDLRLFPFPPFGAVTWWWEVRDSAGHQLTTPPSTFRYEDNRMDWFTRTAGPVTVHSAVDNPPYIQAALDIAKASLERIARSLHAPLPEKVDIYLYPSLMDLQAALRMAGRTWVQGQAHPELGVVLLTIPADDGYLLQMEQDIPHELTHLLIYRLVGPEGYTWIPTWLNEGLAMANQTHPDPNLDALLDRARREGRLIPLRDLCPPFPTNPEMALLAYAESGSLVRYLRRKHGDSGLRALLLTYADGADCDAGVQQALHLSLDQLERAWRADLSGMGPWMLWLSENGVGLALWGLSLLLAIPIALAGRRNTPYAGQK